MGRINKTGKIFIWGVGLLLLAFLIQYPIQKSDPTWETWSLPLAGKTIVLDPGHGPPCSGSRTIVFLFKKVIRHGRHGHCRLRGKRSFLILGMGVLMAERLVKMKQRKKTSHYLWLKNYRITYNNQVPLFI